MTEINAHEPPIIVDRDGDRLTLTWDNRLIPKKRYKAIVTACLGILFATFWALGIGGMFYFRKLDLFCLLWCTAISLGILIIAMQWLTRFAVEQIEIDSKTYRHGFVGYKWLFPHRFPTSAIHSITLHQERIPSNCYLTCVAGSRRDLIAWWADVRFQRRIWELLRAHCADIKARIRFEDFTQ